MNKRIYVNNKNKIVILNGFLFFVFVFFVLVPFLFVNYLGLSGVGHFFADNIIFSIIGVIILFYFIIVGVYYYKISIDGYMINVRSSRSIFELLQQKDQVEIPHHMLVDYSFFNRPYSLNKTLMLRIRSSSDKVIIKRFNFSLISNEEVQKISSLLSSIIVTKS